MCHDQQGNTNLRVFKRKELREIFCPVQDDGLYRVRIHYEFVHLIQADFENALIAMVGPCVQNGER